MTSSTTFPSTIILIVSVMAIVIVVRKLRIKLTQISWRGSLIISSLYLGILIIIVPIFYLQPAEGFLKSVENRTSAEALAEKAVTDLFNHHLPTGGNLDEFPGLYKNSSYTFLIETRKLSFNVSNASGNYPIFVTRKNTDDGKIEVSTYAATQFVGKIDYTKLVLPPIVNFHNGTLYVKPVQQSLNLIQCNTDFTVNQFEKQNVGYNSGIGSTFGENMVYIRVPKSLDVEINDTERNFVQMISND